MILQRLESYDPSVRSCTVPSQCKSMGQGRQLSNRVELRHTHFTHAHGRLFSITEQQSLTPHTDTLLLSKPNTFIKGQQVFIKTVMTDVKTQTEIAPVMIPRSRFKHLSDFLNWFESLFDFRMPNFAPHIFYVSLVTIKLFLQTITTLRLSMIKVYIQTTLVQFSIYLKFNLLQSWWISFDPRTSFQFYI